MRKVFRLRNGTLIGFAGDVARIQQVMRELRKNPERITTYKGDDINALVVYPDGVVRELGSTGWLEIKAPYHAIGYGETIARVAMDCGKSAADAVRKAMKFCPNTTGGKVQTVRLKK